MTLRIAVVTTNTSNGGAALAAISLANACSRAIDIEISIWSQERLIDDVSRSSSKKLMAYWFQLKRKLVRIIRVLDWANEGIYKSYSVLPSGLDRKINHWAPDVIHLHWICGEFISIEEIKNLKAPIIWTLHDAWPISGSEHHQVTNSRLSSFVCSRYFATMVSDWVLRRKLRNWMGMNMTFACPSKWMMEKASKADVSANKSRVLIRNGVDTDQYRPIKVDSTLFKRINRIAQSSKILLVGSMTAANDPIKGFDLFRDAVSILNGYRDDLVVVCVGSSSNQMQELIPNSVSIGHADASEMVRLYNMAVTTCLPSRIETHSMFAAESICCGTPVTAFDVTGNPSVVEHKRTGYLAMQEDPQDFAMGILYCIESLELSRDQVGAIGCKHFNLERVALEHIGIYKDVATGKIGPKRQRGS